MDTATIWTAFGKNMHRYLRKRVTCEADADDLLQDIFLKIHLKLPTLTHQESLTTWVWRLTHNTLTDYHRAKRVTLQPLLEVKETVLPEPDSEFNQLLAICVQPFLAMMSESQREAIELADFQKISQKELALQWGIGYSGAKSRVQRARTELETLFRACCHIECDEYGNVLHYEPHCQSNGLCK
jgi:RNA polymerase sigma-70 factor, ECF subfamily